MVEVHRQASASAAEPSCSEAVVAGTDHCPWELVATADWAIAGAVVVVAVVAVVVVEVAAVVQQLADLPCMEIVVALAVVTAVSVVEVAPSLGLDQWWAAAASVANPATGDCLLAPVD